MDVALQQIVLPFFGKYDKDSQPHILDLSNDQLSFDYIKWRPKLVSQLQRICEQKLLQTQYMKSQSMEKRNKIVQIKEKFEQCQWKWVPVGQYKYGVFKNELHDVPMEWLPVLALEELETRVKRVEEQLKRLTSVHALST